VFLWSCKHTWERWGELEKAVETLVPLESLKLDRNFYSCNNHRVPEIGKFVWYTNGGCFIGPVVIDSDKDIYLTVVHLQTFSKPDGYGSGLEISIP